MPFRPGLSRLRVRRHLRLARRDGLKREVDAVAHSEFQKISRSAGLLDRDMTGTWGDLAGSWAIACH